MSEWLQYFRPGEEARMLARCQFGIEPDGRCGAIMTYPIQGYPWRRNPVRLFEFQIDPDHAGRLFAEARALPDEHPDHCLGDDVLWSDHSEKANGITRDRRTDTLCHTIAVYGDDGRPAAYYSMREDSGVLQASDLYQTVAGFIRPHESL